MSDPNVPSNSKPGEQEPQAQPTPETYQPAPQPEPPQAQQPIQPEPPQAPPVQPPQYGAPQYAPPQYAPPQPQYGVPAAPVPRSTNALAILSLVFSGLGIIGVLPLIGSIAGIILGHISKSQIRRTGEGGSGLALAGLIIGYVSLGLLVVLAIVFFAVFLPMIIQYSEQYPANALAALSV